MDRFESAHEIDWPAVNSVNACYDVFNVHVALMASLGQYQKSCTKRLKTKGINTNGGNHKYQCLTMSCFIMALVVHVKLEYIDQLA